MPGVARRRAEGGGSHMPDGVNELIGRVRNGDDAAFTELCGRYAHLLDSSASRYANAGREYGDLRDDLRQEAAMALYRAAMTYDVEQTAVTFGLYAKTCIRNALVSELRVLGKNARRREKDEAALEESAEHVVVTEEMRELLLRRARDLLSPFELEVMMLALDGMRPRHIAGQLETSAKSVSNALFRAREKMRAARDE